MHTVLFKILFSVSNAEVIYAKKLLKILYSIGQDSGNISAVEKSLTFLKIYNLLILRIYNSGYNNHRNSWTINYKLNI